MNIFIFANPYKDRNLTVTRQVAHLLAEQGANILLSEECRPLCDLSFVEYMSEGEAFSKANIVVSVGGDGTLLHAAKGCIPYDIPILGVNVGRLGFLATFEVNELPQKLTRVMEGKYTLDKRHLLDARMLGSVPWRCTVLNDVVIYCENHLQTADFYIYCDDILVNHFSSDGVIISTPTGSTAYSLSAGGPILDARIAGCLVVPICAHSLKSPAMVFSADRKLTITARPRYGDSVYVSGDGVQKCRMAFDSVVEICMAPKELKLISLSSADQFEAIDKKLMGR